jgi:CheY-like chemotaxis protein
MKKILIVSDLKSLIREQRHILKNRGLKIFSASSGEEALSIHTREQVDLIVTDIDMLGMSGDTLCSVIRNDKTLSGVSIMIVCSKRGSDLERCTNCGANAFITRPLDPAQFIEKADQLIDVPRRSGVREMVKAAIKGSFRNRPFFGISVNISTTGILFETEKIVSKGDAITCSFFMPDAHCITVDCKVVRVVRVAPDAYQCGAKFLDLHPDHRAAIEMFVSK